MLEGGTSGGLGIGVGVDWIDSKSRDKSLAVVFGPVETELDNRICLENSHTA